MAGICLAAGGVLAWHHPLWPMVALALFWSWSVIAAWYPGAWLFVVPACLPFLNFSPWTGWLVFDEFDLLLLGAMAGGYARWAWAAERLNTSTAKASKAYIVLCVVGMVGGGALLRGLADAGGFAFDWFAGYGDALNSVRVFKSLGFALLLFPLQRQELHKSSDAAMQQLARGMVVGLVVVTLAVVWERAASVGLWNFVSNYRTVGLFWEMHIGGAAIDSYLALAVPFVVWALVSARQKTTWGADALLALLTGYACLTTFSRGVYLATVVPLLLLVLLRWRQTPGVRIRDHLWQQLAAAWAGWRTRGGAVLALLLVLEIGAVFTGNSFMAQRMSRTGQDLESRIEHWRRGVDLLDSPVRWWMGIGAGRLPANYVAHVPAEGFSGSVVQGKEPGPDLIGNRFATLRSPDNLEDLPGTFSLAQRVTLDTVEKLRVSMSVRAKYPVDLLVAFCEKHLLYDGACQETLVQVLPKGADWQTLVFPLLGGVSGSDGVRIPRLNFFSIALESAGASVDIGNVKLLGTQGQNFLENGSFNHGLAQWFPLVQSYFVPWHIDNFYLEILIEWGAIGALLMGLVSFCAFGQLVFGRGRSGVMAPYLAASLSGIFLVGLVSSVFDVPRVAFLLFLLLMTSCQLGIAPTR